MEYAKTFAALFAMMLAFMLAFVFAPPAAGHDGDHPIGCVDVQVPANADCHDPGDAPNSPQSEHPLCIVETPGVGSAAADFKFVECLPATGSTDGLGLLIAGILVVAAGALTLRKVDRDEA